MCFTNEEKQKIFEDQKDHNASIKKLEIAVTELSSRVESLENNRYEELISKFVERLNDFEKTFKEYNDKYK